MSLIKRKSDLRQWNIWVTSTVLLGLLTLATGASAATIPVTAGGQNEWFFQSDACSLAGATGSQTFEAGPGTPPLGQGSLEQRVGSNGFTRSTLGQMGWNGVSLGSIAELRYSTYVDQPGSGSQAPYMILNIDTNGDSVVDDRLTFEPAFQNSVFTGLPLQGNVMIGSWQTWDALRGGWWSANGIAGATSGLGVKSLAAYRAAAPNARIINDSQSNTGGVRIASGCGSGWSAFVGNVDNVLLANYGTTGTATSTALTSNTYDFEPAPGSIPVLACSPSSVSTTVGQPVTLSASGGSGSYTWSGTGLTILNPNGKQFTVAYNNPSVNTVNVTSGNQIASCVVTVFAAASLPPIDTTPGLPNTGTGGGAAADYMLLAALTAVALGGVYVGYRQKEV